MLLWAWGHFFFFMMQKMKTPLGECTCVSKSCSKNDATVRIHVWLEAFPSYALMELVLQFTASFGFYNSNYETPLQK